MGNLEKGVFSLTVLIISVILALVLFSADNVDAYRRGGSRYYRSYRYSYYSRYYYYRYYGYSVSGSSSSGGIIAGAVVGGIVAVVFIVVVVCLIRYKYFRTSTVKKSGPSVQVKLHTPHSVIEKRQEFHERKGPAYFEQPPGYNNLYGQQPPPGAFQYQPAYPPPSDPAYPPGYVPR